MLNPLVKGLVEALRESKDRVMDQIARGNKAISEICPKCDYQCQGCIRALDDMDELKCKLIKALAPFKEVEK